MEPGELHQLLNSNDLDRTFVLTNIYEIETVLETIQNVDSQIDYFTGLKQHRADVLNKKLSFLKDKSSILRDIILNSMKQLAPKQTTLNFPGLGKVTKASGKKDWTILDQESMMEFLDSHGVKNQVVEVIETLDKQKLKPILDSFEEQKVSIPGVERATPKDNVRVTFESDGDDTEIEVAEKPKSKESKSKKKTNTETPEKKAMTDVSAQKSNAAFSESDL